MLQKGTCERVIIDLIICVSVLNGRIIGSQPFSESLFLSKSAGRARSASSERPKKGSVISVGSSSNHTESSRPKKYHISNRVLKKVEKKKDIKKARTARKSSKSPSPSIKSEVWDIESKRSARDNANESASQGSLLINVMPRGWEEISDKRSGEKRVSSKKTQETVEYASSLCPSESASQLLARPENKLFLKDNVISNETGKAVLSNINFGDDPTIGADHQEHMPMNTSWFTVQASDGVHADDEQISPEGYLPLEGDTYAEDFASVPNLECFEEETVYPQAFDDNAIWYSTESTEQNNILYDCYNLEAENDFPVEYEDDGYYETQYSATPDEVDSYNPDYLCPVQTVDFQYENTGSFPSCETDHYECSSNYYNLEDVAVSHDDQQFLQDHVDYRTNSGTTGFDDIAVDSVDYFYGASVPHCSFLRPDSSYNLSYSQY